ncbi:MAG: LysR family transcriptional regulator [Silvanigrellaceae bacterium]
MVQKQNIPIELIPTFLLLAEELNISKCAKRLGLSQPALTRQLQTLEESFGTQLFIRQSRGLALTQTGRSLKKEILPGYENLVNALTRVQKTNAELDGALTFGCFSEIGTHLIAPALFEFAKTHPQVQLDIRYLSEAEIIAAVSNGQLHLGTASRAPDAESVRSYKLVEEKVQIVTARGNPDLEKNPKARFAGYRANDRLLQAFLKTHFPGRFREGPNIAVSVNSHQAMLDAVIKLELYAALPEHSITAALRDGKIRLATAKECKNQVHIIMPDSEFPDRKTLEVVKFLRKKFKSLEG